MSIQTAEPVEEGRQQLGVSVSALHIGDFICLLSRALTSPHHHEITHQLIKGVILYFEKNVTRNEIE